MQIGSISRVHGGYIELVWLVVWNMVFRTFHILGIMINFSEGLKPPTSIAKLGAKKYDNYRLWYRMVYDITNYRAILVTPQCLGTIVPQAGNSWEKQPLSGHLEVAVKIFRGSGIDAF